MLCGQEVRTTEATACIYCQLKRTPRCCQYTRTHLNQIIKIKFLGKIKEYDECEYIKQTNLAPKQGQ